MTSYNNSKMAAFSLLDEPLLSFCPNDQSLDENPLRGLNRHGAYDGATFPNFVSELRLATIAPVARWDNLKTLVEILRNFQKPSDRNEYVPDYKGFREVFGVPIVAAEKDAHIKWPNDIALLGNSGSPHEKLKFALRKGMDSLSLNKDKFDVVLVYLPDAWQVAFRASGFDARDTLKALGAFYSIPTQIINDRAFTFPYKASLAWRLSIALYVKAGGIPWKLAPLKGVPDNSAYIGLAYALRRNTKDAHYVTCCSQVFDADGGGMQFVAFEATDPVQNIDEARRNPFLSKNDMRAVLARSLSLYQSRNGGLLPRRLVVHKTTSFKSGELQGVQDALSAIKEVECLSISENPGWRGTWLLKSKDVKKSSIPDRYPVPRGTMLQKSGTSVLVWVAGNAPQVSSRPNYYQGGKSIPRPISLTRFIGSGPFEVSSLEALALTKMDWNNDALYNPVPVTICYSRKLARTIANVPSLPGKAYPYRLFM